MIEVAKAHERTCQEYQMHKQAHSGGASNYTNPLLQTSALTKSFQRHPPKRPCGKCGRSHGHGDCPAQGATCNTCGRKNHWSTVCRTRRHSSTGCYTLPGKATATKAEETKWQAFQERQRRHREQAALWQETGYSQDTVQAKDAQSLIPSKLLSHSLLHRHTLPKCLVRLARRNMVEPGKTGWPFETSTPSQRCR